MGLWGVLWEIFKVAAPHAAPHVARAVKEHRAAGLAEPRANAVAQEIAHEFTTLEERIAAAELKAAASEARAADAEEKLSLLQTQMAGRWATMRIWALALLAWNAVITAVLVYLLAARR